MGDLDLQQRPAKMRVVGVNFWGITMVKWQHSAALGVILALGANGFVWAQEGTSGAETLDFLNDQPAEQTAQATPEPEARAQATTEAEASAEPPAEPETPTGPTRRANPKLDEIMVTAQKRAEDIQDVPLSVTAIGGEDIKEKNMSDLNDVATFAPNLSILATPTFNFIYMRGLGSGYNRGLEQSVATIIDEVYYGRPSYLSNGLLDLAAVEVLRGPQGTLFGKNSAAGALHLRTAQPEFEWGADVDATFGERGLRRFRGAVTGPIAGDDIAFRLAILNERQTGDIVNTSLDDRKERNLDNATYRGKLRWDHSANFANTLTLTYATVDQGGSGTQLTKVRARHLAAMQVFDPQTTGDVYDDKTHQDFGGFVDRYTFDATLVTEWELKNGLLITNVANYAKLKEEVEFDADFSPIPFLILENDENYEQFSEELRFTSAPGEFEYVGGLYFFRNVVEANYNVTDFLELHEILGITGEGENTVCGYLPQLSALPLINGTQLAAACQNFEIDNAALGTTFGQLAKQRVDAEGQPVSERSTTLFDQESNSFAVFGQGTWHATDRFSLTVGGRIAYEVKKVTIDHGLFNERTGIRGSGVPFDLSGNPNPNFVPGGSVTFPIIQAGNEDFTESRERTEFNFSPKVSATMQWTDDIMSYVTIAQGYKGGGFNAQPLKPEDVEFEEEVSNTYEVGFKSEFLGGGARLNVSGFYTQFKDLQIAAFDGTGFVVTNAASATIKGIEYEWAFVPMFGIFFTGNGSLIDAKYDTFTTGPCSAENPGADVCDLSGRELTNAPKWQHQVGLTIDMPVFNLVNFHAGMTASYQSVMWFATDLDPVDRRESGWLLGGRIGVRDLNDRWSAMIFVSNILDRLDLAGNNDVPTFVGSHFGGRIPTTEIEGQLRIKF